MMSDMLFVSSSHPLSVCIYSLDNRVKQLPDTVRADIKEPLKPELRFVTLCWSIFAFSKESISFFM